MPRRCDRLFVVPATSFVEWQALAVLLGFILALTSAAQADEPQQGAGARLEFFEKRIRPLLIRHCYECHSNDAKKIGGSLKLDSRQAVARGGDSGAVLVPGDVDNSLLIKAVRYSDEAIQMPPKGKLSSQEIQDLEVWVRDGAVDSRDSSAPATEEPSWTETFRERSQWWSLQPVRPPGIPAVKNSSWPNSPLDTFVLAALESAGLAPAPQADPQSFIRRMSLVLTGLPPAPELVDGFADRLQEDAPERQEAVAQLADLLLSSPHFGEHWARHWMDVVRFSETHGNEWNYEVHHAWRYRDYLIRAFNDDVPFDQLIREHIAGDLLPNPRRNRDEHFNESVIGTGFYRFGEVNHDDCISLRSIGYDLADNQIDTLTKAFQATTVACARCHDHKFDAVSAEDYYALLGVLRSSRMVSHSIDDSSVNADRLSQLAQLKRELRNEVAAVWLAESDRMAIAMLQAELPPVWQTVITAEKLPVEDILHPWQQLAASVSTEPTAGSADSSFAAVWNTVANHYTTVDRERTEFNESQFTTFADFRHGEESRQQLSESWQIGGQGLREPPSAGGEFMLHTDGPDVFRAILPAGWYTSLLSDKSNGTLRSTVLPAGPRQISFQVMGQRSSAVRLVSNNCQLNYANYRALTAADAQWITFSPPPDREDLRTYAELMTMFDNPKFPDQLSALGGDTANYRVPWEKAAENPRSWFGIQKIVFHDSAEPPRADLHHLHPIFDEPAPTSREVLAERYAGVTRKSVEAWTEGRATDDDARWLDGLLRHQVLTNQVTMSAKVSELVAKYREVESMLEVPRVCVGVGDSGTGIRQPVFVRGDCSQPSHEVDRRYLQVLAEPGEVFEGPESGRLRIAEQIADARNPLTSRVFVNRVWHHLFGTGIVRTVDDFGHVGDPPSHPELLDYLAGEFIAQRWSVKRLIREILLTKTFQASHEPSADSVLVDPRNRLLQHYPARRMEAESVRDSILLTSGLLDPTLGGLSIHPWRDKEYADRRLFPGPIDGNHRRSIYIRNNLMEAPRFLEAFNLPGGKVAQGRRDITNVPAQALALLNDPFVLQQADAWAHSLMAQHDLSVRARLDRMIRRSLSRSPLPGELERLENAVSELAELHGVAEAQALDRDVLVSHAVWRDLAHMFFNLSEFIYIP